MNLFKYFAYGSNLLTTRLTARCPSARPLGIVCAEGFALDFSKPSIDGSGKATLTPSEQANVQGVLYEIEVSERSALDRAEYGYARIDDFTLAGRTDRATTYIAERPEHGLAPYDWYLALIIAGAREHEFDANYTAALCAQPHINDRRNVCEFRTQAHKALQLAGYQSVRHVLG